jgi:hypothetical protein
MMMIVIIIIIIISSFTTKSPPFNISSWNNKIHVNKNVSDSSCTFNYPLQVNTVEKVSGLVLLRCTAAMGQGAQLIYSIQSERGSIECDARSNSETA